MAYARALLKLSGEALMGDQGYGIDPAIVQSIAEDVAKVIAGGTQLAIVVGGGNIIRGATLAKAGTVDQSTADYTNAHIPTHKHLTTKHTYYHTN